jgi:hypothetical protein
MPIHDWTRVDAGLFHAFHQGWVSALCNALNDGQLPPDYFALPEQTIRGPIPDVLTLHLPPGLVPPTSDTGTLAVATAPPRTRWVRHREAECYTEKANRIAVRHLDGDVVAVIEIVSPGNKGSRADFVAFVNKLRELLSQKVHLLVIDLFPPGPRDPHGAHHAIWEEFQDDDIEPPPDKPLLLVAYDAGYWTAYVEPAGVGDALPDMPLFLRPGEYIPTPLETTYQATWASFPAVLKKLLEPPPQLPR